MTSLDEIGVIVRAWNDERDQWGGMRTNKGKPLPFELVRHKRKTIVSPVVKAAWADYDDACAEYESVIDEACARAVLRALTAQKPGGVR